MVGRLIQSSAKTAVVARRRPHGSRALAAFLTGFGLAAMAFAGLRSGVAAGLVNALNNPIAFITHEAEGGGAAVPAPAVLRVSSGEAPATKRKAAIGSARMIEGPFSLPRHSVCVRLCDGFYFPIGPVSNGKDFASQESTCAGLCPDAPTQLFTEPAGSDKIEEAVSNNGARYESLPTAFRSRMTVDRTCACHRSPGQVFPLVDDPTLRDGDSIMTPAGVMVFRGGRDLPHPRNDFVALAKATMPPGRRAVLAGLERSSLPNMRQSGVKLLPARQSEIAFAGPTPKRAPPPAANRLIRFVD